MTDRVGVCVLGMHRSGTSLVTRMLELLGVYLGPEAHQMPPSANNPRGYSENQLVTDSNDELLAQLGGSWHEPPAVSVETFERAAVADLRRSARRLLETEFGDAPLWGWKDPRTCLVVPFWEFLVPSLRYVLCVRNPADVARSLARSDGIIGGAELWLRYTSDSLAYTRGKPRIVVFYDDVLAGWRSELARLAAFIDREPEIENAARAIDADGTVDLELCHHRENLADSLDDPRVPLPAKALYLVLRLSHPPDSTDVLDHGSIEAFARAACESLHSPGKTARRLPFPADAPEEVGLL
jgi:hypothetical protein